MKLKELIDESLLVEKKGPAEGNKDKEGRRRLISTVYNKIIDMGAHASKQEVKNYIVHMYKLWESKSPKVDWILKLEDKAVSLGFNPRDYKDQEPGDSAGVSNPGQKEYKGRAFFFVALTNNFAEHFVNKYNKHKGKKENKK